ncbi:MAG: helix-turn-helix domain-containing protein [Magnetococcus sp. MYC-9]
MDAIDIKAALERRGWSLRRLGLANGYSSGSAKKVLRNAWPQMEWIVANTLAMKPWEIWPDRYPNGPVHPPSSGSRRKTINLSTGDSA